MKKVLKQNKNPGKSGKSGKIQERTKQKKGKINFQKTN